MILHPQRDAICIASSDNSPPVLRRFMRAQRHLVAGRCRADASAAARPSPVHVSHAGARGRGRNRSEMPSANIVTGPQWSRLFGGPLQMHCPTHVKNDGNVRGTRITNTGLHDMGGKSLNKRRPAAVPGSPDHNGEPPVTVVVLNLVGIIIAPPTTKR